MQKIEITDEHLFIDGRDINWSEIVGIRRFDSELIRQLSTRGPFSEIFLKGGRSVKIKSNISIEGQVDNLLSKSKNSDYCQYFKLIELIEKNAVNINRDISSWKEWRLILVPVILEALLFFYCLLARKSLPELVTVIIMGGIIGLPLGWMWENRARKKYWR